MKKEDAAWNPDINYLVKNLGKQIEKLDQAHRSGDSGKFNIIKKQVLELQRKIHSLI